MNNTIYSFWISGVLKNINHLTIRSFQNHGHNFVIYAYEPFGLTGDCEVRDAREILPESEIFYYKNMLGGNPNFKFGGIAERLKAEMLYQLGGWHVDLDVTCLKNFNSICHDVLMANESWEKLRNAGENIYTPIEPDYVLRPHEKGVVGNIIKAPKHSELARRYVEHTKTIDENNRIWEKSFMGLNKIVTDLGLEKYILPKEVLGDDSSEYWEKFLKAGSVPNPELCAIHHCGAMAAYEKYEKGSYFETLLKQYNLYVREVNELPTVGTHYIGKLENKESEKCPTASEIADEIMRKQSEKINRSEKKRLMLSYQYLDFKNKTTL